MRFLLGIDLGTSGTKTVLFDEFGKAVAAHTVEYPMYQPKNGYAEQDPSDWWNAACVTAKKVVEDSGVLPSQIVGIGISGQMHGIVMLDEAGNVLRNSIIWCDGRTEKQCQLITETIGRKRLIELTANPALTGFSLGKILWVRENEPEVYKKCAHILLPKDYIRYRLTGELATEVSDASGMNLLDIRTRDWCDEIIEKLSLDKAMLPKVYESADVVGYVTAEAAKKTGLAEGIAVVGGAGDNAAAAVGVGVVKNGTAFTTIGTSGVIFAHTDKMMLDPEGRVHTFCAAAKGGYTVMSCTLAAGLSLKWARDTFCTSEIEVAKGLDTDPYNIMTAMAERVPIGSERLLFLPYLMGERSPILDSKARGAFIGLSGIHEKKEIIRSVLEGVMYSQKHCLEVLNEMEVLPEVMLACGGGGRSPLWRQMMADLFEFPVNTVSNQEGPALGVALLAGVGAGVYKNIEEACQKAIVYNEPQAPIQENTEKYLKFYEIYKKLYDNLKDSFESLSSL